MDLPNGKGGPCSPYSYPYEKGLMGGSVTQISHYPSICFSLSLGGGGLEVEESVLMDQALSGTFLEDLFV